MIPILDLSFLDGYVGVIQAGREEAKKALEEFRSDSPTPIDPVAPEVFDLFLQAMNKGMYKGWMKTPLKVRIEVKDDEPS